MRACLIAGLLIVIVAPALHAQSTPRTDEEILAQAEAAFQRGVDNKSRFLLARRHFAEAASLYRELHRRGVRSPALYRSLGNAALLADRWPEAIWAYHLGLALDPNDAAMREHLAFARAKVLYPPSGEGRLDADTWPAWLHRPTRFELFCVFVAAYSLAWLAGTCAWLGSGRMVAVGALVAGLALLIGAGGWLWHADRQADIDRATPLVVIAENSAFYQGNAASYPQHASLPLLPRGMEARQIHVRGSWLQIRLSTGEVGWLPRRQVLVVEP
jgi:hypothetical protein